MKKLLALVLALVMTLSLCTVSNAAYSDAADVDYKEAVDVMTAAGVFNGTDGKFNPDGILTREQAAKIVTYMLLGQKAADALVTIAAPFADVAADRWSAGSIAYCYNEGILAGVGEGKFAPTAQLTGLAFAKMMLTALGYDAEVEGLTGANWSINAAKMALTLGLTKKLDDVSLAAPMTREQAAQMALNTELATLVDYDTQSTITAGNVTIKTNTKAAKVAAVETGTPGVYYGYKLVNTDNDAYAQFCERYCTKLSYNANAVTSDLCAPAHSWKYDTTSVGTYANAPVASFTAKTSAKDVAAALAGYSFKKNGSTDVYKIENTTKRNFTADVAKAVLTSDADPDLTPNLALIDATETIAKELADLTANGVTVEFYETNDDYIIDKVVIITPEVARVSSVTKASDKTTYSIDGKNMIDYVDEDADDTIVFVTAPAKGDFVTFVKGTDAYHVYPTTTVVGKQTSFVTDNTGANAKTIVVDGKTYTRGAGVVGADALTTNTTSDDNFYLDQFGYVVKTTAAAASTDYALLVGLTASLVDGIDYDVPTLLGRFVLADGSVKEYTIATSFKNGSGYYIKNIGSTGNLIVNDASAVAGTVITDAAADLGFTANTTYPVFGYTLSENTITLEPITAAAGATVAESTVYQWKNTSVDKNETAWTCAAPASADVTVLSDVNTTYVIYNPTDKVASVYTGPANLPNAVTGKDGWTVMKTLSNSTTSARASLIFIVDGTIVADATTDYVYIDAAKFTTSTVDGVAGTKTYVGTKADGTTIDLVDLKSSEVVDGVSGLYSYTANNTVKALLADVTDVTFTDNKYAYDNELVVTGADDNMLEVGFGSTKAYFNITDETQVVYMSTAVSEVDGSKGFVVLKTDNSGNNTANVATIYVTGAKDSTTFVLPAAATVADVKAALAVTGCTKVTKQGTLTVSDDVAVGATQTLTVTGQVTFGAGKTITGAVGAKLVLDVATAASNTPATTFYSAMDTAVAAGSAVGNGTYVWTLDCDSTAGTQSGWLKQ